MGAETQEVSKTISVPENPTPENIARLILENPSIIASVAFQIGENRALKCLRGGEEVDILTPEMATRVDAILRDGVSGIGMVHTTIGG